MRHNIDHADSFAYLLRVCGTDLPDPQREYHFHPTRQWRFDFAWPSVSVNGFRVHGGVAVEIDGGQWQAGGGRHNTDDDREKLNEAAALGWCVLHFSPKQMRDQGGQCVDVLRRALQQEPTP